MSETKKKLLSDLKKSGLNIAEDSIKKVVSAVLDGIINYTRETENSIDDVVASLLVAAKDRIMAVVDKIDGENDENPVETPVAAKVEAKKEKKPAKARK